MLSDNYIHYLLPTLLFFAPLTLTNHNSLDTRQTFNLSLSKTTMTSKELAPLQHALESILARLSCLESKAGIASESSAGPATTAASVEGQLRHKDTATV